MTEFALLGIFCVIGLCLSAVWAAGAFASRAAVRYRVAALVLVVVTLVGLLVSLNGSRDAALKSCLDRGGVSVVDTGRGGTDLCLSEDGRIVP